jgi:hypothetical protein
MLYIISYTYYKEAEKACERKRNRLPAPVAREALRDEEERRREALDASI